MSYFSKANECYLSKDYSKAITYYNKSIENEENVAPSYYNMAICYLKLKEWDEAILLLKESIRLKKNDSRFYFNLGYCYAMLKDNKAAIINFYKAKKIDPSDKDTDKAIECILKESPELSNVILDDEEKIEINVPVKDCVANVEIIEELKNEELNISVLVKQSKLIKQINQALDEGDRDKFMKLSKRLKNILDKAKKECLSGEMNIAIPQGECI